jgi:hypothetical protein
MLFYYKGQSKSVVPKKMSVTVEVNAMFTLAPWCFILVAFLVMFELVKFLSLLNYWRYAQIIFPAGLAGHWLSIRILLFGKMELDHTLSTFS